MPPPPFDQNLAHRHFAIELNNLAWQLVESDHRSPADLERMLHAAHAACYHWLQVGNLLNHLRAQCLLATAYAQARLPEPALRHAQKCLALSHQAAATQTPFDRATAHACAATAYALAGKMDEAHSHHHLATTATQDFTDPAELPLFHRLYPAP